MSTGSPSNSFSTLNIHAACRRFSSCSLHSDCYFDICRFETTPNAHTCQTMHWCCHIAFVRKEFRTVANFNPILHGRPKSREHNDRVVSRVVWHAGNYGIYLLLWSGDVERRVVNKHNSSRIAALHCVISGSNCALNSDTEKTARKQPMSRSPFIIVNRLSQ